MGNQTYWGPFRRGAEGYSNMTTEVVVLMGGRSSEREVSIMSGVAVSESLRDNGYNVTKIDFQTGDLLLEQLVKKSPDVIFNALHGKHGEDGCVQGLLNILGIPYTHSGVTASAIAMDKHMTKKVLDTSNILFPDHQILTRDDLSSKLSIEVPFVIKPITEGSSVGVKIIRDEKEINFKTLDWPSNNLLMVEKYIPGRELTVAVLGGKGLAVTEIIPASDFYDYYSKYEVGGSNHIIPAELSEETYGEALKVASLVHKNLGCRGVSRADFRFDGEKLYFLELNTQPGMTPTSLVPEQAAFVDIPFSNLVKRLVEEAKCDP